MIHYPFEHRAKSNSIVAAECSRESNDRDFMWRLYSSETFWMLHLWIKLRQQTSITAKKNIGLLYLRSSLKEHVRGSSSMVSFVDDDSLHHLRIELHKPVFIIQCLIRRNSPAQNCQHLFNKNSQTKKKKKEAREKNTHTSASPLATCFCPCSSSTTQSGNILRT